MILVDTSIWIDLMRSDEGLVMGPVDGFREQMLLHDCVIGELALGNFRNRRTAFRRLAGILKAPVAPAEIVLELIEDVPLYGTGIGCVDAHLLASTLLIEGGRLWTRDKRLRVVADRIGIRADIE